MDRLLFGAFCLLLGALAENQKCADFQILATTEDYEKRMYDDTLWITTKIQDKTMQEALNAHERLKKYCSQIEDNGEGTCSDNWPVLVTVKNDAEYFLSWCFASNSEEPTPSSDSDVTVQDLPRGVAYVRKFGGLPSIQSGEDNAELLREALNEAGETFNQHVSYAAGYDHMISLTHRNEIWIFQT